jgi:hypothetical protein
MFYYVFLCSFLYYSISFCKTLFFAGFFPFGACRKKIDGVLTSADILFYRISAERRELSKLQERAGRGVKTNVTGIYERIWNGAMCGVASVNGRPRYSASILS